MKRILVFLLAATVVFVAGVAVFLLQHEDERLAMPLEAVPSDAKFVLEFNGMGAPPALLDNVAYADLFKESEFFGPTLHRFFTLDSLAGNAIAGAAVLHASCPNGDGYHHVITVIRPQTAMTSVELVKMLDPLLRGAAPLKEGITPGKIFLVPDIYLSGLVSNGLILLSEDTALLKNAQSALHTGASLQADRRFQLARSSAGKNVPMNVYMRLPSTLVNSTSIWNELGDWMVLDFNVRDAGPVMNGFTYQADSLPRMLKLFQMQAPQRMDFQRMMPSRVGALTMFGASDFRKLYLDHLSMMEARGLKKQYEDSLAAMNSWLNINILDHFLPWVGGQFGTCAIPLSTSQGSQAVFAIFQTTSNELTDELLHGLANRSGSDSASVRAIKVPNLLRNLFGPLLPMQETSYFARSDDFVIFGNSIESVNIYLDQVRAAKTLLTDLTFSRFAENFSSTYNVFVYQRLPLTNEASGTHLSKDGLMAERELGNLFAKLPAIGFQWSSIGKSFYTNVHWQYDPASGQRPAQEYAAMMDAELQGRPLWVRNHISSEWEVLAQDRNNTLYLFNRTGQELFKRSLPETIIGAPVQVNRFKNGFLQYLFCTKNYIYIIDRNGKDVEGFPVELESPATAPVQVLDYDDNRNYRLIVPCKNKRVYNFEIDGKQVKGWKFDRTDSEAATPMIYLRSKRKDHLAIIDTEGKVNLLDRSGARRASVKEAIVPSGQGVLQGFDAKDGRYSGFYITDAEGTVHCIGTEGRVTLFSLGKFSADHRFLVIDLNNDGRPEFVISDLNMVKVFGTDKNLIFQQRLAPDAIGPFAIKLKDGTQAIGYAFPDDEQLMLFDAGGAQVQGFPIDGSSAFSLVSAPGGESLVVTGIGKGLIIHTLE